MANSRAFWNERFAQTAYVYGEAPNEFVKSKLKGMKAGKVLFPCEGEGRNAVYAATLGWDVCAFDQSEEGKKKAELLAQRHNVKFDYKISDIENAEYPAESFDALVLVFAHFPSAVRRKFHKTLTSFVKKGGCLILEGFDKKHIANQAVNPHAGGPKDVDMLFDINELKTDFEGFKFVEIAEVVDNLNEGDYHKGKSNLVRVFAIKN
ncbi:MAG: class I SAM-dependent methyltransferase [Bacteroidia bacterium]|nr:class I SAM-dependent methyltransferase [Bacteroidia bacterium]MCO5253217.1 class I SAM-dependent methyltransferase [Bacteroidota bacterium]MCZ2128828.1 class I SAM-dependent methyltransferase [Bacteroidia bacterium]